MYEDLEPIANLKYGQVVESISSEMQSRLSEAIAKFSSRGLQQSGPMDAEKLRIRLDGCRRICRSVYETWLDLIPRKSGGSITREDIDFITTKVEGCAKLRVSDVRSTSNSSIVTTPEWAAQQADMKMQGVAADIRRELEIKYREQEAFSNKPTTEMDNNVRSPLPSVRLDPLLNIPDKGAFNTDIEAFCRRASAQNPLSLILADVDRFKNVNDTYGYQVGDEVLKDVSQALTVVCGHKGTLYRWGGEEFAILLENYALAEAEALAERLRSHLASIQRKSGPRTITASFGVSTFPEGVSETTRLFQAVNDEVQSAKRNGRNRVCATKVAKAPRAATTLTQHSLSVFMRTDESVRKLDEEISQSSGQPLERTHDASFNVIEKAKTLKVTTIEEIEDLIRSSGDVIRKMGRCFIHTDSIPVGYSVSFALDIAAARLGESAARSYFQSLRLTTTPEAYVREFMETLSLIEGAR